MRQFMVDNINKKEKERIKMKYEKATAEVTYFDNSDVITTSGCVTWSSQNGHECHGGLQLSGGDLNPPLD